MIWLCQCHLIKLVWYESHAVKERNHAVRVELPVCHRVATNVALLSWSSIKKITNIIK